MDSHVARERYFRSYLGIRYRHLNRTGTSSKPASVRQRGQSVGLLSRIFLTLPETVASGGCSLSKLKLRPIKNTLRAMMAQNGSLRDVISVFFRGTMFSKNRRANNQNMPLFTIFLLQLLSVEKIRGGQKATNVTFLPFFYNKFCLSKNQGGMALPPK